MSSPTTMEDSIKLSTNILRDGERSFRYFKTPNADRTANQIMNDFKLGTRAFNVIGSYGTGKSSFLLAFQQSMEGVFPHFLFENRPKVEFLKVVGEYSNLSDSLIELLEITGTRPGPKEILSELYNKYYDLQDKNGILVLVIDEFGKFLEHAANHSPEKELYFFQQLAEFANDTQHNFLLITTVHQNFDSYANGLTSSQKQEWSKVKGRFREIPFNEPIEQLLFLASEFLEKEFQGDLIQIQAAKKLVLNSNSIQINPDFAEKISSKLFPLDLLSANAITLCLQKYGQNERSLFSFLESTDHSGLKNFNKKENPFYNLACVFDYLQYNFYSLLNSKYNPDLPTWASIRGAIESTITKFDSDQDACQKIIKSIGLLQITSKEGAILDFNFLEKYARMCLGINNAGELISDLLKFKIIRFNKVKNRFGIFEGMDLDIDSALLEASAKVDDVRDIPALLNAQIRLDPVLARKYSYQTGTPRTFKFEISEFPISKEPKGEIDGFINLVFNENLSEKEVLNASQNTDEAILFGLFTNSAQIKSQLFEIEKTKKVISENQEDRIAIKELENIRLHHENLLKHFILNQLYTSKSEISWFFNGERVALDSKRMFNQFLSIICDTVYPLAPSYRSELVNRHKLSSAISTAKKSYFTALVNHWDKPDLGFEKEKFPPEKTIYLTLLKANGINLSADKLIGFQEIDNDSSFLSVWNHSETFLQETKNGKRPIDDLFQILRKRPFKLKDGLLDFWIGSFLFIKRNDFALFANGVYIPVLTQDVLETLVREPKEYSIKAFNIEGVRSEIFNNYRILLNQQTKDSVGNQTFIETIRPFLTFYRDLPNYSKNTRRLAKVSLGFRDAIANAKDPEKSFFEDFPLALGFNVNKLQNSPESLVEYSVKLQDSIKELRTAYSALIDRFEEFIQIEIIGKQVEFEELKSLLQGRFKKLKSHLCLSHQKVFLQRIDAPIDERDPYLEAVASAILGKALNQIKDEEEPVLYTKFQEMVFELDNLLTLVKTEINQDNEVLLGIQVSSFVGGVQKSLVRMPKAKQAEADKIENQIRAILSIDKSVNIAAMASILNELIKK